MKAQRVLNQSATTSVAPSAKGFHHPAPVAGLWTKLAGAAKATSTRVDASDSNVAINNRAVCASEYTTQPRGMGACMQRVV
jgi:hypothetical protein